MTVVLIICEYHCEQKVLDTVYSGKVPDSANNGSSQKSSGSPLIQCEVLDRPAWNSHSEEQRWHPTFGLASSCQLRYSLKIINRPGVAGAVLQSPPLFICSFFH